MILNEQEFEAAVGRILFNCKCDYCSEEFTRSKRSILAGKHVIQKDACKKCVQKKKEETNLKLYGVKNYGGSQESLQKAKNTCLKKYGVENAAQSEEFKQKAKATCLEKYGKTSYLATKECKEKAKATCLKKYGVENAAQSEECKQKSKETCLEKYGVEYYSETEKYKKSVKKTCLEKYGVENYAMTDESKKRFKETCLAKYGVEYPLQSPEIHKKLQNTNLEKYGVKHSLQNSEVYSKVTATCLAKYGVEHPLQNSDISKKIKQTCLEKYGVSSPLVLLENRKYGKTEEEIKQWICSIGFEFNKNYVILDGKEIDLYNENLKIGIEYCGLYWHNELSPAPRDRHYHKLKYDRCKNQNIMLITIFEDEWTHRNKQCKNRIKSILNIYEKTIYGRNCDLKIIDKKIASNFINTYHIQGSNNLSIINFGLFYNDELVQILSLGRHPRKQKELTLDRMCFKDNIKILGGSQKLFKAAKIWAIENKYTSIISWSDNRWSKGKVYEHLGFTLDKELSADYSYVDLNNITKKTRLSKQSQKKKKNQIQTENQMTLEKGLAKIWDCGKKRWIYYLP